MSPASVRTAKGLKRVMIVNGTADVLDLLEGVLDSGRYDVVFAESSAHAYTQIRRIRPELVILCVRIEDLTGFRLLTMLKLDEETAAIPVLTYTTEYEGQPIDAYLNERSADEARPPQLPLSRH